MTVSVDKTRFTSGEWSKELQARFDLDKYAGACKQIQNFIVKPEGGAFNRGGFKYSSEGGTFLGFIRLVPYEYSAEQSYILAFTFNGQIYVIKDGELLTSGGSPVIITFHSFSSGTRLPEFDWAQKDNTLYCVHREVPPITIERDSSDETVWTLSTPTFGPSVPTIAMSCTPSAPVQYSWNLSAVDLTTGEEGEVLYPGVTSAGAGDALSWTPLTPNINYQYRLYVKAPSDDVWRLVAVFVGAETGYTIPNPFDPSTYPLGSPYLASNAYDFDATGDYPATVAISKQRLIFGSTVNRPAGVFASQVGRYTNFNYSGDLRDSDAFGFDIDVDRGGRIAWLVPREVLLAGTDRAEYTLTVDTPTTAAASRNSEYGSALNVKPERQGRSVLFVNATKDAIFDQTFDYQSEGYTANDLSVYARHLFEGRQISAIAFQRGRIPTLWVVASGRLFGMTYDSAQGVLAWCPHTSGLINEAAITDVTTVYNYSTGEDDVYVYNASRDSVELLTDHQPADERFLENSDRADLTLANFLDYSRTSDVGALNIDTLFTGSQTAVLRNSGHGLTAAQENTTFVDVRGVPTFSEANGVFRFEYVNSVTVRLKEYQPLTVDIADCAYIVTDDSVLSEVTLTNTGGTFRIPTETHGDFSYLASTPGVQAVADGVVHESVTIDGSGNITFSNPVSVVHVGVPYKGKLETVDFLYNTQQGGTKDKDRDINEAVIYLKNTRSLRIGGSEPGFIVDVPFPKAEVYGDADPFFTGDQVVQIEGSGERESSVYIEVTQPVSCHVLGITGRVQAGDA